MHLSWVNLTLDDVKYGDVAMVQLVSVGSSADHHVLGLEQSPHHVQDRRLPDVGALLLRGQRGVARHQEVEPGGGDEGGDQTDQVVVHVAGVAEGRGGHRHDGRHQLVDLGQGGVADVESVRGDPVEGGVVQNNDTICRLSQSLQCQDGVVRLDHYIRDVSHGVVSFVFLVGKHAVGLNKLLRIPKG